MIISRTPMFCVLSISSLSLGASTVTKMLMMMRPCVVEPLRHLGRGIIYFIFSILAGWSVFNVKIEGIALPRENSCEALSRRLPPAWLYRTWRMCELFCILDSFQVDRFPSRTVTVLSPNRTRMVQTLLASLRCSSALSADRVWQKHLGLFYSLEDTEGFI